MRRQDRDVMPDEIRYDESGDLDEIVVDHPDFFHMEQMDTNAWWLGITKGRDREDLHVWISLEKRKLVVKVTDNGIGAREVRPG